MPSSTSSTDSISDEESVSSSDRSPTSSLISNSNLIEENLLNDDIKSTSTSTTGSSPESKSLELPSTSTLTKDDNNNISINNNNNNNSISKSQRNANNEIFFGGVNKTVNEEELLEIFNESSDNNVLEIRLMKDKLTGESKGFGFVLFNDRSMCRNVIDKLNGKSIKGKIIEVKQSENKRKLFIGNLPKDLSKEQFISIFNEKTEGIESIDFLMSPDQPNKNRGFAFIEYQDHYLADTARRILTASTVKLGDYITTLTVNWSDPDPTTLDPQNDPLENKEIKAIYIRNLPLNHRNDQSITKIINDIIQENSLSLLNNKDYIIEKIIIPQGAPTLEIINNLNNNNNNNLNINNNNINSLNNSNNNSKRDYAFVHLKTRELAEEILRIHEEKPININGKVLSLSFAKPIDKKLRSDKIQRKLQRISNNQKNNLNNNFNNINNGNLFGNAPIISNINPHIPQHFKNSSVHYNQNNNNINNNINNNNSNNNNNNNNNNNQQQLLQQQFLNYLNNNTNNNFNNFNGNLPIDNPYFQLLQQQQLQPQQLYFNYPNSLNNGNFQKKRFTPY
ncbi:hypothetical protein ACTFIZ_006466 [Dictyostelium cf. discoideum]